MKKLLSLLLAATMTISLAACNSDDASESSSDSESSVASEANENNDPEFVTVKTLNPEKEVIDIEVPYNAERLAVLDLAVLDMLDNFGFGDRVVGVAKGSSIDYLQDYVTDDSIVNLGTIKEADLEAVMECEPDIIFIGGRLSSFYDELSEIAPVVYIATDVEDGIVQSTNDNAMNIASIFGVEDTVSDLMADYDDRIAALS